MITTRPSWLPPASSRRKYWPSPGKTGGYILIVEGGIPTKKGHGMIGNKEMLEVFKRNAAPAIAILAIGSCATDGGVPAAKPNPSQIIGTAEALETGRHQ